MTAFALLFTMCAVGIAETAYLVRQRILSEKPICPIGGGCLVVLSSKYNRTFGVHNDMLGMVFYIMTGVLTALLFLGGMPSLIALRSLLLLALAIATLMSLRFFLLQWLVLRAWCFWCLMSAATIAIMDLVLILSQHPL